MGPAVTGTLTRPLGELRFESGVPGGSEATESGAEVEKLLFTVQLRPPIGSDYAPPPYQPFPVPRQPDALSSRGGLDRDRYRDRDRVEHRPVLRKIDESS